MKPTYLGGAGGGVELNKATQKNKYKKYENKNTGYQYPESVVDDENFRDSRRECAD